MINPLDWLVSLLPSPRIPSGQTVEVANGSVGWMPDGDSMVLTVLRNKGCDREAPSAACIPLSIAELSEVIEAGRAVLREVGD